MLVGFVLGGSSTETTPSPEMVIWVAVGGIEMFGCSGRPRSAEATTTCPFALTEKLPARV